MPGTNPSRGRSSVTRGVNDRMLRVEARERHRDLDPQALLTETVVRRYVDSRICPYCGAGPFVLLASHTSRAHGVSPLELRHAAGLRSKHSLSTPDHQAAMRAHRANLIESGALTDKDGARAIAARRAEEWRAVEGRIQVLVNQGLSYKAIAEALGIPESRISARLRGTATAAQRRSLYHDSQQGKGLAPAIRASQKAAAERRDETRTIWGRGQQDWPALVALAERTGRSIKQMRAYLKSIGCEVPDGRSAPSRKRRTNYTRKPKPPCTLCERDAVCRGLCTLHYQRAFRAGAVKAT